MKKTKQLTLAGAVEAMLDHRAVYGVVGLEPGNMLVSELEQYEMFFEYEDVPEEPEEKPVSAIVEKEAKATKPEPKKKSGRPKKQAAPEQKPSVSELNADFIIEKHLEGKSREWIANQCGCTPADVVTLLREKGVIDVVPAA